jgi:hypothetical protein
MTQLRESARISSGHSSVKGQPATSFWMAMMASVQKTKLKVRAVRRIQFIRRRFAGAAPVRRIATSILRE